MLKNVSYPVACTSMTQWMIMVKMGMMLTVMMRRIMIMRLLIIMMMPSVWLPRARVMISLVLGPCLNRMEAPLSAVIEKFMGSVITVLQSMRS